jgi:hypothetical protein
MDILMVARWGLGCGRGKKGAGNISRKNKLGNRVLFLGPVLVTVFCPSLPHNSPRFATQIPRSAHGFSSKPPAKTPFSNPKPAHFFCTKKVFV